MNQSSQQIDSKLGFLRLSRSIKNAFINGELQFEEMIVIIWLFWEANPHNGNVKTSYNSLKDDFKGKYSKNYLNKIVLSLKRKKWLWFPNQQGRRGSFIVALNYYPLANKHNSDINHLFKEATGRSSAEESISSTAEVKDSRQKLETTENSLSKGLTTQTSNGCGRSANNDNENKKKNYNIDNESSSKKYPDNPSLPTKKIIPVQSFVPKNHEQNECLNMAKKLNETNMRFLLSRLKPENGGLNNLEKAWGIFQEIPQERIENKRKYFNQLVRNLNNKHIINN